LIASTLERSNDLQKERINALLGKNDLSLSEVEELGTIISSSGASLFVEDLIEKLTTESLASLENSAVSDDAKAFLIHMASVATKRSK
jgi:geranylgeranyl pyrophosphate synthase